MNWEAVGAIAELTGGVGVIGSLVYLAIQIRQNTRSMRAASYHAVVTNLSTLSGALGRDADAASLLMEGRENPDGLNAKEFHQFGLIMISLFRSYENIFYQHRQGMIDSSGWHGWETSMTQAFWGPGVQAWWPTWRDHCQEGFRDFLEASKRPVGSRPK